MTIFNSSEKIECAFTSEKSADAWIDKHEAMLNIISDEKYEDIQNDVNYQLYKMQSEYYDMSTGKLLEGKTDDEWDEVYEDYDMFGKYVFIKEKYGYTKEEVETKEDMVIRELVGFIKKEIVLFEEAKKEEDDK